MLVNTEHTREAITKEQMRKFLKFVHDDNVYCEYYEVFCILFHTGIPFQRQEWNAGGGAAMGTQIQACG